MGRCYEQGHPQCLKNVMTVGLLSLFGMGSSNVEGAFDPMDGGEDTSIGEGANQDGYSVKIDNIVEISVFD